LDAEGSQYPGTTEKMKDVSVPQWRYPFCSDPSINILNWPILPPKPMPSGFVLVMLGISNTVRIRRTWSRCRCSRHGCDLRFAASDRHQTWARARKVQSRRASGMPWRASTPLEQTQPRCFPLRRVRRADWHLEQRVNRPRASVVVLVPG